MKLVWDRSRNAVGFGDRPDPVPSKAADEAGLSARREAWVDDWFRQRVVGHVRADLVVEGMERLKLKAVRRWVFI